GTVGPQTAQRRGDTALAEGGSGARPAPPAFRRALQQARLPRPVGPHRLDASSVRNRRTGARPVRVRSVRGQGTGNGERGTGNGEQGTGNGEQGTGNGERGTGNGGHHR